MDQKFKDLTICLCKKLSLTTYQFLMNNTKDEENITDIINLVLSAHLSSLFNCMMEIASHNKENADMVEKFINQLQDYIKTLEPISSIVIL